MNAHSRLVASCKWQKGQPAFAPAQLLASAMMHNAQGRRCCVQGGELKAGAQSMLCAHYRQSLSWQAASPRTHSALVTTWLPPHTHSVLVTTSNPLSAGYHLVTTSNSLSAYTHRHSVYAVRLPHLESCHLIPAQHAHCPSPSLNAGCLASRLVTTSYPLSVNTHRHSIYVSRLPHLEADYHLETHSVLTHTDTPST